MTETTVPRHGASAVPTFEVMVGPQTVSTSRELFLKRYEYLRGLARAHPGARAVGCKLMYDQTRDHPWLVSMLMLMRVARPTRKRALERIENGDDVCAALAGTPYESLAA